MKKFLLLIGALTITSMVHANVMVVDNVNMDNFWIKNGVEVQKVDSVARKLIHTNNLKRAPLIVDRNWRVPNAKTYLFTKTVFINTGLLPYINNDDELAFVLGHELAHAQDAYGGFTKLIAMTCNNKKYEYKADLYAIDYMVKAGYDPIAAITVSNRILEEPLWDWGFKYTHPKGSKRLIKMYEYIYKKYPAYLSSPMTKDLAYTDFLKNFEKELNSFRQKQMKKNTNL